MRSEHIVHLTCIGTLIIPWNSEATRDATDSNRPKSRALMGLSTVAWGISTTRKQFGHPFALRRAISWVRRYPLVRRTAHLQPEGISVGVSMLGGRLTPVFISQPHFPLADQGRPVCVAEALIR
jgi:hypothetical protein